MTKEQAIIDKIVTRGHWRVVIRPTDFDKALVVDAATLFEVVRTTAVSLRGWNLPHVGREEPSFGDDYVEQASEFNGHIEFWRMFQSGQFYLLRAIRSDWVPEFERTKVLWTLHTIYTFTEIFEFASRLATTDAGGERMSISITANGLGGRRLWADPAEQLPFMEDYVCHPARGSSMRSNEFERDDLLANGRSYALREAREFFLRFGWNPTLDTLAELQAGLFKK
jgi:hypothetical protein